MLYTFDCTVQLRMLSGCLLVWDVKHCSKTTLTGESWIHISLPRIFEPGSLVTESKQVSPLDQWDMVRLQAHHRAPPSSRLRRLWSWKRDLQRAWNRDRKAVWDQVGLQHCWHGGLVMVRDEARLRRGHDDQSRRVHQCSKTTLKGESWFHISPPGDLNLGPLWQEANRLVHWTSETWWDCRLSTASRKAGAKDWK
jgi:hypothetical protein